MIKKLMPARLSYSDWETCQGELAWIPGESGSTLRSQHYPKFFGFYGKGVVIDEGCCFTHPERICLSEDVRINREFICYGSGGVFIGAHVRIGPRCFLHSANHEQDLSRGCYHETGYNYAAVHIGPMCLISANVAILPGANLGAGCFVACGATVTRKSFPELTRLVGVPARPFGGCSPSTQATEIAHSTEVFGIRVADQQEKECWQAILEYLRLPQVAVYLGNQPLPESVRGQLVTDRARSASDSSVMTWKMDKSCNLNHIQDLPQAIQHSWSPSAAKQESCWSQLVSLQFYYSFKRLSKLPSRARRVELFWWLVANQLFVFHDIHGCVEWRRSFDKVITEFDVAQVRCEIQPDSSSWNNSIVPMAARLLMENKKSPWMTSVQISCLTDICRGNISGKVEGNGVATIRKALWFAIAINSNETILARQILSDFRARERLDERCGMWFENSSCSGGYCYSPLLIPILATLAGEHHESLDFCHRRLTHAPLDWRRPEIKSAGNFFTASDSI